MLPERGRDERGAGLLTWIAISLLVVLAVVAFSQQRATGEATLAVSRSMAGELGLSLGTSVLEESMHQVRSGANDPTSPLFQLLRKPVRAPDAGRLPLSQLARGDEAPALLEREPFKAFSFTGPQAEVVYQRQMEDLPYERTGLIHYWTRVAGAAGLSDTVVREVHAYQEFRTVLITTPRPFDELPLYLGRATALTDLASANEQRGKLVALYARAHDALSRAAKAATGPAAADYAKMLEEARPPAQMAEAAPPLGQDPDAHVTAVWLSGQGFALEAMDLARRLAPLVQDGERRVRDLESAAQSAAANPGSEAAHDRVMETGSETLTFLLGELLRVWGFARAFTFIPRGDPQWESWERRAQERLTWDHFRRMAFFVIREQPELGSRGSVQAQFDALRKRVATPAGQPMDLNGVVVVEGRTEPLTLTGELHGKLVVAVARGGLVLKDVNPRPEPGDSLVAVALGGTLEMSGTVNAAVIAAPLAVEGRNELPRVVSRPGTVLRGMLLVPGGVAGAEWNGTLTYDDRYFAGPAAGDRIGWPDHYYVGVAPRAAFRSVVRK